MVGKQEISEALDEVSKGCSDQKDAQRFWKITGLEEQIPQKEAMKSEEYLSDKITGAMYIEKEQHHSIQLVGVK